ncbi:MAG: SDR family NAD(P)-dependent oxidoreductase [Actinomycetota bacterium]
MTGSPDAHQTARASSADLDGRVALVTGAAGDIGRAVAVRSAQAGCRVVLADLAGTSDGLDATAAACRDAGGGPEPITTTFDVTDEAGVEAAIADLADQAVVADLVFNNAGYQGAFANTVDYGLDDFRRVQEINVVGAFIVLRACARRLVERQLPGSIVNTASMAFGGAPNMVAYSASKAAVIGMTKAAAKDLAPHRVRVNSLSPAFIGPGVMWDRQVELQASAPSQYYANDPALVAEQMIGQVPLRRYGSLDEVADAALFLLSDASSYITAFNLEVAGGAG